MGTLTAMRPAARTAARILVGACLVAGLASCGGDDGPSESDEIADVLETAATTTNPNHCTQLLTPRALEQSELEKGRAAIESCREDAKDAAGNAESVSVSNVKVTDASATATAAFEGGNGNGQAVNVSLIKQGDQWKIDHVDSYARFDRKKFLEAGRAALVRPPNALPEEVAECITGRFDRLSDKEIQAFTIEADPARVTALVTPCVQNRQQEQGGDEEAPAAHRPKFRSPARAVA